MRSRDEEIEYRTPITDAIPVVPSSPPQDAANYNTLKVVEGILVSAVNDLFKDFNTIDIHKDDIDAVAAQKLLRDIDGRQIAYSYIRPALDATQAAIRTVEQQV